MIFIHQKKTPKKHHFILMFYQTSSESESEEEDYNKKGHTFAADAEDNFAFDESESESDGGQRVVRTPYQNFLRTLEDHIQQMTRSADQNKWNDAWTSMVALKKLIKKRRTLLKGREPPRYYLIHMNRFLATIEEAAANPKSIDEDKDLKNKKLHKKKFTQFRNKILRSREVPFEKELKLFAEKNDIWAEEIEEEESEEEVEAIDAGVNWASSDEEDGGDEDGVNWADSDDDGGEVKKLHPRMREFWLKKEYQPDWVKKQLEKKSGAKKVRGAKKNANEAGPEKKIQGAAKEEKKVVWNESSIRKKITKILSGKGSVDRKERKELLKKLSEIDQKCERTQWSMLVKLLIIDNIRDLYTAPRCMTAEIWNQVARYTSELIDLLTENQGFRLHDRGLRKLLLNEEEKEKLREKEHVEETNVGAFTPMSHGLADAQEMLNSCRVEEVDDDLVEGLSEDFYWLRGNLHAICIRLSEDLILGYKKSDNKTKEYDALLQANESLVVLCQKCLEYVSSVTKHRMNMLSFRHLIIQLTYQTYDKEFDQLKLPQNTVYVPFTIPQDTLTLQHVVHIFKELKEFNAEDFGAVDEHEIEFFNSKKQKIEVETVLFCTHYLALHHRYELARDIFTSSGYGKDSTFMSKCEILIQILYNRTVARLAIAAFTHEDWRQSMDLLKSLYMTGKLKELLAQGVKSDLKWKHNKTQEEIVQEQQETQRMVPEHTFINQDLLESVHYISSLFFEMKAILSPKDSSVGNRSFRRQWEFRQKREFLAPPENTRDRILESGAQMMKGNWRACVSQLEQLKCWDHFEYADEIKRRVFQRAKRECLRCYLISSAKHFSDIQLSVLATKFEMTEAEVVKFSSQFIVNQDIRASINSIGGYLVIHEPLPTLFETSATNFHNKLSQFLSTIHEQADMVGIKSGGRDNFKRSNRDNNRAGGSWR